MIFFFFSTLKIIFFLKRIFASGKSVIERERERERALLCIFLESINYCFTRLTLLNENRKQINFMVIFVDNMSEMLIYIHVETLF